MTKNNKKTKTCGDCIHEYACAAWNVGTINDMDATNCTIFETVKDSTAYFIGFREGWKTASGIVPQEVKKNDRQRSI